MSKIWKRNRRRRMVHYEIATMSDPGMWWAMRFKRWVFSDDPRANSGSSTHRRYMTAAKAWRTARGIRDRVAAVGGSGHVVILKHCRRRGRWETWEWWISVSREDDVPAPWTPPVV